MGRCPQCGAPVVEGALFCDECAAPLLAEARVHMNRAKGQLRVLPKGVTLTLEGPGVWVLGRGRPRNLAPGERWIDLEPYDGYRYGVSRRHARLEITPEGRALLTDLHSSNGTRVDYVRLTPEVPYPLPPVAYIRLGKLILEWSQDQR